MSVMSVARLLALMTTRKVKILIVTIQFQYLRIPSILLSSWSANFSGDEKEDQVRLYQNLYFLIRFIFRSGQYEFPKPEWTNVSTECKNLIKLCLKTNPDERPTIDQVIASPWISVRNDL